MKIEINNIVNFQYNISNILTSNITFTEAIEQFTRESLSLFRSFNLFKNLKLYNIELEIIEGEKLYNCNIYTINEFEIAPNIELNKRIPSKIALINKKERISFLDSSILKLGSSKYLFPIYVSYGDSNRILYNLVGFEPLRDNTEEVLLNTCQLLSELIDVNTSRIISAFQKKLADKIDSVSLSFGEKLYQSKIESELKKIAEIIENELSYDLCDFMICYPNQKNKLCYLNSKGITNVSYKIHSESKSLAVKSFLQLSDIKLISNDRIMELADSRLIKNIETQFSKGNYKKLNRWVSIVIKGRNSDPIGLIKLFQFEETNISFFSFSLMNFLLTKSIQRTIYHIMKDHFILQNEMNSRNGVIDNLMHQVVSPLGALVEHCKNVIANHTRKEFQLHDRLLYIRNLSFECSDKAKGFQHLINFEHGKLNPKIVRIHDMRIEILKKVIDFQPKAKADRGIKIHLDYDNSNNTIPCNIDQTLFSHVLSNLLDNALKYSFDIEDRKELGFTEKPIEKLDIANIYLTINRTNSNVIIILKNLGAPIAQEEEIKIFERKYRGKFSNDYSVVGNGLGLYIVKKFLELMGGKIYFVRHSNKYISTFKIELNG